MLFKHSKQLIENGLNKEIRKKRSDLLHILEEVIISIDPYYLISNLIKEDELKLSQHTFNIRDYEHIHLIGFGKSSVGMAQAICDKLPIDSGAVITNNKQTSVNHDHIDTFYGEHPITNLGSIDGTYQVQQIISNCSSNDLLLVLISGGGSSLLCSPLVPLSDLQKITTLLMNSGVTITEMNTIRKHLSQVKGGQLIKSTSCPVVSLVLSDINLDPLDTIASGPTYPDPTTFQDASLVLHKYQLWKKAPISVQNIIINGMKGIIPETPSSDELIFEHVYHEIIGNNMLACKAAATSASKLGYHPEIISTDISGEARLTGLWFIEQSEKQMKKENHVFIGGGETTVVVQGSGAGGRNQEMALGSIEYLSGKDYVFSCFATDGVDGTSPAAGAIVDGYSLERAKKQHLKNTSYLKENNSFHFFKALDDTIISGPTGSNVMDVYILFS